MDGRPGELTHGTVLLAAAGLLCGCASGGQLEVVEAHLRQQRDRVAELEEELEAVRGKLAATRRQRDGLLERLAGAGGPAWRPEQADLLARAVELKVNSWLTGGNDLDNHPGDDELVVLLQPLDADGEPVKLPGRLRIELIDPAFDESDRRLGTWTFSPAECRGRWHSGMLARGFLFHLPWQTVPRHARLLLHAHLDTGDGRGFDADALIDIELAPE